MAHPVLDLLAQTISAGLQRKSIVSCSRWAEKYRVMGKPFAGKFSFKHHPWSKEMHDCDDEMWVGQKAAQVGFTEAALNRVMYTIDIKRIDCMYVLPSKTPDASDFSASRFDGALDLSSHLSTMFSEVKNVGHKRAGSTNLYIRGSHSKSSLKSVPVGLLVLDELEEMDQDNIELARERLSGQIERQTIAISTPRIPNRGVNKLYLNSTQEHFFFRCPHCGRLTELVFPECLEITAESVSDPRINDTFIKCKECKTKLDHTSKTEWLKESMWVPSHTAMPYRGFHVNQLYSPTTRPSEIASLYLKALVDPSAEQEFWNSKIGTVHEVKGARVLESEIMACIAGHMMGCQVKNSSIITLGIDQGKDIHYEIAEWDVPYYSNSIDINAEASSKVIEVGKLSQFEDIDSKIKKWGVNACVIDAHPEKRKALELAYRFPGLVHLCYYGEGVNGKDLSQWSTEPAITVDRTSWMDAALGRFRSSRMLTLPVDTPYEYKEQVKAPVRVYVRDKMGNSVGRYVVGDNVADHYAHAHTYAEIALKLAVGNAGSRSIKSPR